MENGQPTNKESVSGSQADTSGDSIKSPNSDSMPLGASKSFRQRITATTPSASPKTWKSAELSALQSKIGLVAGALADFQEAGGVIALTEIAYSSPSGSKTMAVKMILLVPEINLVVADTTDGMDFSLVADTQPTEKGDTK